MGICPPACPQLALVCGQGQLLGAGNSLCPGALIHLPGIPVPRDAACCPTQSSSFTNPTASLTHNKITWIEPKISQVSQSGECYLSKKLEDAPISKFALCPFYHACLISCLAFPPVNVVHPGSREGSSGKAFSQQHLQAIPNQDLQQVTPPQEHLSSTGPWFL